MPSDVNVETGANQQWSKLLSGCYKMNEMKWQSGGNLLVFEATAGTGLRWEMSMVIGLDHVKSRLIVTRTVVHLADFRNFSPSFAFHHFLQS